MKKKRESKAPKVYREIALLIERRQDPAFVPRRVLPKSEALQKRFKVAEGTITNVLKDLTRDGLLTRP